MPPNPRRGTSWKGAAEGVAHRGDFWEETRGDWEGWELWEGMRIKE